MSVVELSHGIVELWIAEKGKLDIGRVESPWRMLLRENERVKHRRVLATCENGQEHLSTNLLLSLQRRL